MADFCKQCADEMGFPESDFIGAVPEGSYLIAICEGCGFDAVMNHAGDCVSSSCLKKHGLHKHPRPYRLGQINLVE